MESPPTVHALICCELIWHEFGHAFANDLLGTYSEELIQRSALYLPLAKPYEKHGKYTRWIDCANEHVIRAVTARLSAQVFSPEQGRQALREDAERGFRYVHAISRRQREHTNRIGQPIPTSPTFTRALSRPLMSWIAPNALDHLSTKRLVLNGTDERLIQAA